MPRNLDYVVEDGMGWQRGVEKKTWDEFLHPRKKPNVS